MNMILDIEKLRQSTLDDGERKLGRDRAKLNVSQLCYTTGISFHDFSFAEFDSICEAIGKFGPSFKNPSEYELRHRSFEAR